jgi:hypothetical protein
MNLLIVDDPHDNDLGRIPWPVHGKTYNVEFEVEYIGKYWEDRPKVEVTECHDDLGHLLAEADIEWLIDSDELPIASGTYKADVTYYQYPYTDWETGHREDDYGFTVSNLKHISPLTKEYLDTLK